MKTLIFTFNKRNDDNLQPMNETENVTAVPVLRPINNFLKCIRKIDLSLPCPLFTSFWLTKDWKIQASNADLIICMAHHWSAKLLRFVNSDKKHRCINYFWDKISISGYSVVKSDCFENWSFDREDCEKYGLKYNPQFYINQIQLNQSPDYDVVFIGSDRSGQWKERTQLVKNTYNLLNANNINSLFYYVSNNKDPEMASYSHKQALPYQDYINKTNQGKTILELVEPGQGWITERVFLALTNKRKLITNNRNINKEDFYSKDNIFILGLDNPASLQEFINTPFNDSFDLSYYSFTSWIERFTMHKGTQHE